MAPDDPDLLSGFDLGDTPPRAAVRRLLDLAARYEAKRGEREGQGSDLPVAGVQGLRTGQGDAGAARRGPRRRRRVAHR